MDTTRGGSLMDTTDLEDVDNIRRMADRGLANALVNEHFRMFVDIFQHILDNVQKIKVRHE